MSLEHALRVALGAADEAGRLALAGMADARRGLRDIGRKLSSSDLVTEHDLAVERAIVARLRAAFPDDEIVAEEGTAGPGGVQGARRWYVDPIDGTTNFAHGLPFFCTSIGLVDEGGPAIAVIEAPALGWRFSARRGDGAYLRERGADPVRLAVSKTAVLGEALLATGFPYDLRTEPLDNVAEFGELQRAAQAVRRVGAAALDLAMVAAGWFDGYWERKLQPWDLAAGILLVTESGGRVSDVRGAPYVVPGGEVVATNGLVHDRLVAALGEVAARG